MRVFVVLTAALLFCCASVGRAQDPYPVTLGVGGGMVSGWDNYHGLLLVSIKPARSPIALRLDGLVTPPDHRGRTTGEMLSAVSASAVIMLRPWRVSPYLVVGATRTSAYGSESLLSGTPYYSPAVTELTGGLGLGMRWRGTNLFGEMRNLKQSGTALSFGVTF